MLVSTRRFIMKIPCYLKLKTNLSKTITNRTTPTKCPPVTTPRVACVWRLVTPASLSHCLAHSLTLSPVFGDSNYIHLWYFKKQYSMSSNIGNVIVNISLNSSKWL